MQRRPQDAWDRRRGRADRESAIAHAPAKTTVEASTATAAPVAPHSAPRAAASGIATSASIPWVTIRSRGRPIDTGSDFVQPIANWIAAASSTMRAAVTAPSYSLPKTTSTSHGIATKKTGTATTMSAAAPSVYLRMPSRTRRARPPPSRASAR